MQTHKQQYWNRIKGQGGEGGRKALKTRVLVELLYSLPQFETGR